MKFIPLAISGLVLIEPTIIKDNRGVFLEEYREDVFATNGISVSFVQSNQSSSSYAALRGLHYQIEPHVQAKLIRVLSGEIFDVAVDIRKNSPSFGKHVAIHLDSESKKMIYIPTGFAHGFCALRDHTEVLYKVSDYYKPDLERGIRWNDPALDIRWPQLNKPYILSAKDQKYPLLKTAEVF